MKRQTKRILAATVGEQATDRIQGIYRNSKVPLGLASNLVFSELRRSSATLRSMRDQHKDERCFVIGNGPSLNKMDLAPLASEMTFGLNRIYLAFERLGFSTSFLIAINKLVIEQAGEEIAAVSSTKFINWEAAKYMPNSNDIIFLQSDRIRGFSRRPDLFGVRTSATVTCVAIQLAHFMGFSEVILIGVDHSFSTKGPAHKKVVSAGDDPNHFDPSYFGKGFRWQLPDLDQSAKGYSELKRIFDDDDRRILDATVDGKLTVFPKIDFRVLF